MNFKPLASTKNFQPKACKTCGYVRNVLVRVETRKDWDVNLVTKEQMGDFLGRCSVCRTMDVHSETCRFYIAPKILTVTEHWAELCEACEYRKRAQMHMTTATEFIKRAMKIEEKRGMMKPEDKT